MITLNEGESHLGAIQRIKVIIELICGIHGLNLKLPLWVVALDNGVVQVVCRMTAISKNRTSRHVPHSNEITDCFQNRTAQCLFFVVNTVSSRGDMGRREGEHQERTCAACSSRQQPEPAHLS